MWSGLQFNESSGALVGTPTYDRYESGVYVGSTSTFTPQKDRIVYAAGSSNENQKELKYGSFGTNGAKTPYGQPKANYNVLHAGR